MNLVSPGFGADGPGCHSVSKGVAVIEIYQGAKSGSEGEAEMNKWEGINRDIELEILAENDNQKGIARLARKSKYCEVREQAVERLNDPELLERVVFTSKHSDSQKLAVERIHDQSRLAKIAMTEWVGFCFRHYIFTGTRVKAIERLVDQNVLQTIIERELRYIVRHPRLACDLAVELLSAAFSRLDDATLSGYLEQTQILAAATHSGAAVREAICARIKNESTLLELCGTNVELAWSMLDQLTKEESIVKLLDRFPDNEHLWQEGLAKIEDPSRYGEMAIRSQHRIYEESIKKRIKDETGRFAIALQAQNSETRLNAAKTIRDQQSLGRLAAAETHNLNRGKILGMVNNVTVLQELAATESIQAEIEQRLIDAWDYERDLLRKAIKQGLLPAAKVEEKLLTIRDDDARLETVEQLFGKGYHGPKAFHNTQNIDLKVWFFLHCRDEAEAIRIIREEREIAVLQKLTAATNWLPDAKHWFRQMVKHVGSSEILAGVILSYYPEDIVEWELGPPPKHQTKVDQRDIEYGITQIEHPKVAEKTRELIAQRIESARKSASSDWEAQAAAETLQREAWEYDRKYR
jgi:hypothetical protein